MKRSRIGDDGELETPQEEPRRGGSVFIKCVYAVFVINVLAVCLLLVGVFSGWFRINGSRVGDGTYRLGLVFNAKEVGEDIDATMKEASNLAATAKSAAGLKTYDGQVKSLNADAPSLVLVSQGEEHVIRFTAATQFDSPGLSSIGDLEVGDPLRLTIQDKDGRLFAVKVKKVALEDIQPAPE